MFEGLLSVLNYECGARCDPTAIAGSLSTVIHRTHGLVRCLDTLRRPSTLRKNTGIIGRATTRTSTVRPRRWRRRMECVPATVHRRPRTRLPSRSHIHVTVGATESTSFPYRVEFADWFDARTGT